MSGLLLVWACLLAGRKVSALFSRLGMFILSCNSIRTAVSMRFNTSLDAIVVMESVEAVIFLFRSSKFSLFYHCSKLYHLDICSWCNFVS